MTAAASTDPPTDLALLRAALEWQIELGADEAIAEAPIDRAATPAASPTIGVKPPQRRSQPPSQPESDPTADAQAAARAADSVEALRATLLAFDGSPLKARARNTVFADGSPAADLMVMGEAPGRDEDFKGLPFVGRSGQLLDRMLAAIGRDRRSEDPAVGAYISNVIPYRPLENRAPDDREVQTLLPFARRHIALARPKLLLCVGNVPAKHLMGATVGITRYRGTWEEIEIDGFRVPALATFHPAYLLRSPDRKGLAWRDLLTVRERLETLTAKH